MLQLSNRIARISTRYIFVTLVFLLMIFAGTANGQVNDSDWAQPTNLSQSGSATAPLLVRDAAGLLYAFWQDPLSGYTISTNVDGVWSPPQIIEAPFGTKAYETNLLETSQVPLFEPALVADWESEHNLHAFWVTDEFELYHSQVNTADGDIALLSTWSKRQQIDDDVAAVKAVVDSNNVLHIVYIFVGGKDKLSAGLYHRVSEDGGLTWSDPVQIYGSSYFRQANEGSVQIDFFIADSGDLFLTWNDPFIEQVFIVGPPIQAEEAYSWPAPQVIDSRNADDGADTVGPANAQAAYLSGDLHLFWTAGHAGIPCALYTRVSSDNGQTWSSSEQVTADDADCPEYFKLLKNDDRLFLFTKNGQQADMRIWKSDGWSVPVSQPELIGFADPVSFRDVVAACPYQFEFYNNSLIAIGCGLGIVEDVWVTSRLLNSFEISAIPQAIWSDAEIITGDNNLILSPIIVSDETGGLHAIWVQSGQEYVKNLEYVEIGNEIYYSRGNGVQWTRPNLLFSSEGSISNPSFKFDSKTGNLLLVWEDSVNQQLLFSQTSAGNAFNVDNWSAPLALPAPFANPSQPSIEVNQSGLIYVTYLVPFNTDRNIYLTHSDDNGFSWSDPTAVFDGEVAAFDIFQEVQTTISLDGALQVVFVNRLAGIDSVRNEFYHLRTIAPLSNKELQWSAPQLIQNQFLQSNPISSYGMSMDHAGRLHLIWQEWNDTQFNLWGTVSVDNGQTWETGGQISGFERLVGPFTLTHDSQGIVHLNQLFLEATAAKDLLKLRHWFFSDGIWLLQNSGSFPDITYNPTNIVAAAEMADQNHLNVIFSGIYSDRGKLSQGLFVTDVMLDADANVSINKVVESTDISQAAEDSVESESATLESSEAVVEDEDVIEESVVEMLPDPSMMVEDVVTPIESFASSGSVTVGVILALSVFAIMLVFIGGYYVVNIALNRQ